MADQINLVPLDQVIEKAEQIYKRLVDAEQKIDDLSKKKLTLAFSEDFRRSARSLDELARAMRVFAQITNIDIAASVKVIDDLIKAINKLDVSFDDSKFQSKNFSELIKAIERLLNLRVGKGGTQSLEAVVRNMTTVITNLSELSAKIPNLQDIEQLGKVFKAVSQSFQKLFNVVDSGAINPKKVGEIAALYGVLATTLQLVSGAVRKLPGGESFNELSSIFQKLGQGLSNLVRATRDFTVKDARNILIIFTGLSAAFQIISTLLRRLPGVDSFEQFARTINLLGTGLSGLARATKSVNLTGTVGKTLEVYVNVLRAFGGALKEFKNASFPDIGGILIGITDAMQQIAKLDSRGLKNIQPVFKEFVKGLNELRGLNLDDNLVDRLEKIFTSLSSLSGSSVSKAGVNLGTDLGDGFNRGLRLSIKDQVLADLIASAIKFAARELNPIALTLRVREFEGAVFKSLKNIQNGLMSLGQTFRQVGDDIKDVGQRIIQNFGLGQLIQSEAFTAAVGFDKLSTQVQVFGNLTEQELRTVQDFANEIGIQYPLSSNEALDSTLQLIKAGQELSSIEFILPTAADLAALSDSGSIEASTRALIAAKTQFSEFADGIPATFDNIASAADILAAGADLSTGSVESLTAGLGNVGPIASQFGLTMQDTVAILATFEDGGIRGAEAGTSLRSALTQLNTDRARSELRRLGVVLTDRTTGQFRDFNDIILDIQAAINKPLPITNIPGLAPQDKARMEEAQKALGRAQRNLLLWNDGLVAGSDDQDKRNARTAEFQRQIAAATGVIQSLTNSETETARVIGYTNRTQEEQVRIIKELFGAYGQTGAAVLLANDGFGDLRDAMEDVEPAAIRAQLLMDNFSGDVEQLRGSMETLLTKAFLPLIQRGFRPFVQIGRLIVDFFLLLPDEVIETISTMVLLASTMATLVGVVLVASGFLLQFAGVILSVSGAFLGLLIDGAALVAGIGAISVAFLTLITVGTILIGGLALISAAITTTFNLVEENVGGAGDAFARFRRSIGELLSALKVLLLVVRDVGELFLGDIFGANVEDQGRRLANIFNRLNQRIQGLVILTTQVSGFFRLFRDFVTLPGRIAAANKEIAKLQTLVGFPPDVLASIKDGATLYEEFVDQVTIFAQTGLARRIFGDDVNAQELVAFLVEAQNQFTLFTANIRRIIGGTFNLMFGDRDQAIRDIESGLGGIISQALSLIADQVIRRGGVVGQNLFSAIFAFKQGDIQGGINNLILSLFETIRTTLVANRGTVVAVATQLFSTLLPGGFIAYLFDLVGLKNVGEAIRAPLQFVRDAFSNLLNTIFDIAQGSSIEDAVFGNFGPIAGNAVVAIGKVIKFLDRLVGVLTNVVKTLFGDEDIANPANNIISQVFNAVSNAFENLERFVLEPLNNSIGQLVENAKNVLAAFVPIGAQILTTFQRAFGPVAEIIQSAIGGGGLDVGALLQGFVDGILTVVGSLPGVLGGIFSTTGTLIGSSFLGDVGTQLAEGDFGGLIETVAKEFVSLIGRAVAVIANFIGTALVNIGTTIGSSFLTELGSQIATGDFGAALTTATTAFVNLVGRVVGQIPTQIGTTLVNLGTVVGSAFLVELGTQIAAGDFTTAINTAAYQFGLLVGDVIIAAAETLGTILTNVGLTVGTAIFNLLGGQMEVADYGAVNGGFVNAVAEMLGDAVRLSIGVLGNFLLGVGTSLGNTFLIELGTQLRDGEFSINLANVASALSDLVTDAIDMIPALIEATGVTLGSPILERFGKDIREGEWGDVIVDIAEGLKKIIQAAFALVPDLLEQAGIFLDIPGLALLGSTVGGILDRVGTSLGTLVTLPLALLGEVLDFIQNLLHLLRGLPDLLKLGLGALAIAGLAHAIRNLGTVLPIVVGAVRSLFFQVLLAAPILRTFFLTTLPNALAATRTAFTRFLIPLAKILFILAIFKNLLSGINVLLDGGTLGAAFTDFLAGLASDLLGFFGIEFPKEQIITQLNQVLAAVELVLLDIALRITTAIQNIFDGFIVSALDAIARITILGGLVQEGFQVDYFRIAEAFDPANAAEFSGLSFFRRLGEVLEDPANLGLVQTQLRTRWTDLWNRFITTDLETVAKENPADLGAIFATMLAAGGGVESSLHILREFGVDVFQTALQEAAKTAPEVVAGLDLSAVMQELGLLVRSAQPGDFTLPEVEEILIGIQAVRPDLTDEQIDSFLSDLFTDVSTRTSRILGEGDGTRVDTEVPVNVTPGPITTEGDANADAQQAMADYFAAVGGMGPQVPIPTGVQPQPTISNTEQFQSDLVYTVAEAAADFEPQPISFVPPFQITPAAAPALPEGVEMPSSPERAALFASSLASVVTKMQELVANAPTFIEQTTAMLAPIQSLTTEIAALKLGVEEQVPVAQTLITTFFQAITDNSAIALLGLQAIRTNFSQLLSAILTTTALATIGVVTFQVAVVIWSNITVSSVNRVTTAVTRLNEKLQNTLLSLAAINASENAQEAGGVQVDGAGAYGVNTFPGGIFRILERGQSELYSEGGKHYLLSANRGEVIPLPFGRGAGAEAPQQPVRGPVNAGELSGSGLTINEGPIQITISGLTGSDAQSITDRVQQAIRQENDRRNNTIRSRLRTGHRG